MPCLCLRSADPSYRNCLALSLHASWLLTIPSKPTIQTTNSILVNCQPHTSLAFSPIFPSSLFLSPDVPEGCVILREHTPMSNLMACLWFNEVHRFTSRDQLSFGYTRDKIQRSVPSWKVNMFLDCQRRNFVVQVCSTGSACASEGACEELARIWFFLLSAVAF